MKRSKSKDSPSISIRSKSASRVKKMLRLCSKWQQSYSQTKKLSACKSLSSEQKVLSRVFLKGAKTAYKRSEVRTRSKRWQKIR